VNVALTEVEIAMLGVAKASASEKEMEAATLYNREYDHDKFEAKITKLVRDVYELDRKMGRDEIWEQSLNTVADDDEDMYLAVILKKAGLRQPVQPWYLPDWRTVQDLLPTMPGRGWNCCGLPPFGKISFPNPILRVVVALCFCRSRADQQAHG
jgi:hypothetical protein